MPIKSKLHYPDSLRPIKPELETLEREIVAACANAGVPESWLCEISVNCQLSADHLKQFSKVNKKVFVAFKTTGVNSAQLQSKFIYKCMLIANPILNRIDNAVILISDNSNASNPTSAKNGANNDGEETASFDAVTPKYALTKVILDDSTFQQIKRSLALIRQQKKIFDEWGFREIDPNTKTILCFFGAPGTGKTMCAHAIAHELGKKVMIASYASIESKWVGEGPKNMRQIFRDAAQQDAVLFFDEADSFLSKRVANAETGSDKHYNRMSNEMFQLLEDYDGVVIFATNLITDFDKAFKSRILSFIEFKTPDTETRQRLISSMLPSQLPLVTPLSDEDFLILAQHSDGFSGREIRKAFLASLSDAAVRNLDTLTLEDLLVGFDSVAEERKAIEAEQTQHKSITADFFEKNRQNDSILDICLWAAWQSEELSDPVKEQLCEICRAFYRDDIPDLTISYKNKDLTQAGKTIIEAGRQKEAMIRATRLLAAGTQNEIERNASIFRLAALLNIADAEPYIGLASSISTINLS